MNENKNYFTINEVEKLTGIKSYTLRYWEKKTGSIIRPIRLSSLHRRYTRKDIENILKIKELLEKGYSFKGIKKFFSKRQNEEITKKDDRFLKTLQEVNKEITEIINIISKN